MDVALPESIAEAVGVLAAEPEATVLAGGTDLMVVVNAGARGLGPVVALARVADLGGWRIDGQDLVVGACCTYTQLLDLEIGRVAPALAAAARTVGSPQIRNAGTLGGNLGTASPAGDTLPVLLAAEATVEVVGADGTRRVPMAEFVIGPKRTALAPGELIAAVRVPVATGPQQYRKVGVRNAMVISVASVALVVDTKARTVRVGLGSVGPVALPAAEAEAFAEDAIDWSVGPEESGPAVVDTATARRFGELVAAAARPIDDHRGTAAYRRHAVGVLAARSLATVFGSAA